MYVQHCNYCHVVGIATTLVCMYIHTHISYFSATTHLPDILYYTVQLLFTRNTNITCVHVCLCPSSEPPYQPQFECCISYSDDKPILRVTSHVCTLLHRVNSNIFSSQHIWPFYCIKVLVPGICIANVYLVSKDYLYPQHEWSMSMSELYICPFFGH